MKLIRVSNTNTGRRRRQTTVMPRLLFVHSIGGPRHADDECRRWAAALTGGMSHTGHSQLAAGAERQDEFAIFTDILEAQLAEAKGEQTIASLTRAAAELRFYGTEQGVGHVHTTTKCLAKATVGGPIANLATR